MKKTKKTNETKSPLFAHQKPIRTAKRKRKQKRNALITIGLGVLLLVTATAIYLKRQDLALFASNIAHRSDKSKSEWTVTVGTQNSERLSNELEEKVAALLTNSLRGKNSFDPVGLARHTQNHFNFKKVTLLTLAPYQLKAIVSMRNPIMRIEVDRTRMIDENGVVYGEAMDSENNLPIVKGTLDISKLVWREDQTLQLDDSHQQIIKQAIELKNDLGRHNIEMESLSFVKFRGFTIILKGRAIEVTMGVPPFAATTDKLAQILEKMKTDGVHSARIELDYKNKAFIKESNSSLN